MRRREDRSLRLVYAAAGGGFASYYLLVSTVPELGARIGGGVAAGLLTFVFVALTVVGQLATRRLVARVGEGPTLAGALLVLGLPALGYDRGGGLGAAAALTGIRGAGFGVLTVLAGLLIAAYSTPERRSRAVGTLGLITGASALVGPGVGLAVFRSAHPRAAFALAAAGACVVAVPLVAGLTQPPLPAQQPVRQLLSSRLAAPLLVFLPAAVALGTVYTFLPIRAGGGAAVALTIFGCTFVLARHAAGRVVHLERAAAGAGALAAGGLILVALASGVGLLVGIAAAGTGVGALCTVTLVALLARHDTDAYAAISTIWNIVYDAGIAVGALVLGAVAESAGAGAAFGAAAGVFLALAVPAALRDVLRPRPAPDVSRR